MVEAKPAQAVTRWTAVVIAALLLAVALLARPAEAGAAELRGKAVSGKVRLGGTPLSLYRAGGASSKPERLASGRTRSNGTFRLRYRAPSSSKAVLYLTAGRGPAVRLASVLGTPRYPGRVVVNERTTVASGYALAQFIGGSKRISGPSPGLQNAAAMVASLVDVGDGHLSPVLRRAPNGRQTSSLQSFNSLANMLPRCARSPYRCRALFRLAKPPGERRPRGALEAVADIARNPGEAVNRLFKLSQAAPTPYRPALQQDEAPDAWTVALRFDGDGESLDGPGNFAIDAKGNIWVNNNYVYGSSPHEPRCGGVELFKFKPDGSFARSSPITGGGLNGAGFGISIAPNDHVWVGNFGFQGLGCTETPPANSVSEFRPNGKAVSPDATSTSTGGYTNGPIDGPQATVPDRDGNIWIANCNNDTVTQFPGGRHEDARVFSDLGIVSPFDIVFNQRGQAFVTGNKSDRVAMLDPDGTPTVRSPISGGGIERPLGAAVDSRGNVWIANSAVLQFAPCAPVAPPFTGTGSATLLSSRGVVDPGSPFTGGGLKVPWGITVDGDDNVWVANFAGQQIGKLCGTRPENCPPNTETGDPISPATGYGSDALSRNTGIAVDPSGNVWLANNWLQIPYQANPGGHEIVAFVGAAAPLDTPVIGPPD